MLLVVATRDSTGDPNPPILDGRLRGTGRVRVCGLGDLDCRVDQRCQGEIDRVRPTHDAVYLRASLACIHAPESRDHERDTATIQIRRRETQMLQ